MSIFMRNFLLVILVITAHIGLIWAISVSKPPTIKPPEVLMVSLVGSVLSARSDDPAPAVEMPGNEPPQAVEMPEPEPIPPEPVPPKPKPPKRTVKPLKPKIQPQTAEPQELATESVASPEVWMSDANQAHGSALPGPADTPAPPQGTSSGGSKEAGVTRPSTNAAYLRNAKPVYPQLSRRRNEEGLVLLHVLVTAQGQAGKVELKRSSGYPRLDESALKAVETWRFVPATRNGVPIQMWYDLPIRFSLTN